MREKHGKGKRMVSKHKEVKRAGVNRSHYNPADKKIYISASRPVLKDGKGNTLLFRLPDSVYIQAMTIRDRNDKRPIVKSKKDMDAVLEWNRKYARVDSTGAHYLVGNDKQRMRDFQKSWPRFDKPPYSKRKRR